MKRILTAIIVILLLIPFCGCEKSNDFRVPVNFYYCTDPIGYNSADAVISAEVREGEGYGEHVQAILELYLKGPVDDGFRRPFPAGVCVENITVADNQVTVFLSREFSQLADHSLTLACTCISMTVMDLTDCDMVRIQVADTLLDGNEYIEINRENLLFLDEYTPETTTD